MKFSSLRSIRHDGFTGFLSVADLLTSKCCDIPKSPGIYLVLRLNSGKPSFYQTKHRKSKYPTTVLKEHWIADSLVLYIGKASTNLRKRIYAYMRFGQNKNSGHSGGRSIWYLRDSDRLVLCWKTISDNHPRIIEKELIQTFASIYGNRPFANLSA
jgi:hypothetical protein